LEQAVPPDGDPERPSVFPHQRHITQVTASGPSRLVFGESVGLSFGYFLFKVELQFFAELLLLAPTLCPPRELPKKRTHRPSSAAASEALPISLAVIYLEVAAHGVGETHPIRLFAR
jgi:hypothetical protein